MKPRLILLLTIDCLRFDAVDLNGSQRRTPTLRVLAENGIAFSQAIAQGPHTPGSFQSLFSSTYPFQYPGADSYFSDQRPSVLQSLSSAGWVCAGFHSNPYLSRAFNYGSGFDEFFDNVSSRGWLGKTKVGVWVLRALRHLRRDLYMRADKLTKKSIEWLESRLPAEDSIFLWIHYMDVHGPYMPDCSLPTESLPLSRRQLWNLWRCSIKSPQSIDETDRHLLKSTYRTKVREIDAALHRVITQLKQLGLLQHSVVIVTADHGECLGEHGVYGHPRLLYDTLLRVPLIITAPGLIPNEIQGTIVEHQVRLLDVAPTILSVAGADIPDEFEGRSLIDSNGQMLVNEDRVAVSEVSGDKNSLPGERKRAIRYEQYKYIETRVNDQVVEEELYDLAADPGETNNIAQKKRGITDDLRRYLRSYAVVDKPLHDPPTDADPEVLYRLRQLGYLE